ncbi:DUF2889 domain-containing protein [Candidatus Puniceispirillum marinum]|jgi:hypothetical protein|uniref:DUF2889 domain-containing protein n=1 Tax=Puniceispirillum marinum (strain IMCC1322) TaxID=488538 RepID=D5BMW0_PUNMI|nr:DUF2889 domain-containing protein [Candidatus Puniceispirillum marinum]ADE40153.1 hypothetical protein SAR116_1910 [Candidatus Puniceispirillum marinum IMCC1322]
MTSIYDGKRPTALSAPVAREKRHQRKITVNGFLRTDGLYDIEAELTDHKTYSFPSDFRGMVTPDQPVHHMHVRITINNDMVIQSAEAVTLAGPYEICPVANDVFADLAGLQIGPGWRRRMMAAIGGRHGCTHITELMGPVATIAFQTRYGEEARQRRETGQLSDKDTQRANAALRNSCVGYADDTAP